MTVEELLDEAVEQQALARVMLPHMMQGYEKGAEGTKRARKPMTSQKREAYRRRSIAYAAQAVKTTQKMLRRVIDETFEEGDGVQGLARRINKLFTRSMGYRSLRIARTQLTETINDGSLDTLISEGHEQKEWSTVIDGQQRETHDAANGQIVGIYESFQVGGAYCQRPGDPDLPPRESINCRCAIVSPRMSRAHKRAHGQLFLRTHGALERAYVVP